jgi:hypothetical protein
MISFADFRDPSFERPIYVPLGRSRGGFPKTLLARAAQGHCLRKSYTYFVGMLEGQLNDEIVIAD